MNYYNKNNEFSYSKNSENSEDGYKDGFDWEVFNKLKTEREKREFLGDIIYQKIENNEEIKNKNTDSKLIEKITGMIIELPSLNDVIKISIKNDLLNERIKEALSLLEYQNKEPKIK